MAPPISPPNANDDASERPASERPASASAEISPEQAAAILRHDAAVEQQVKLRSRRAFVGLGLAGLAGALGWR